MGKLRIMDASGDTTLTWHPDVRKDVEAVRAKFDELIQHGFIAYQTDTAITAPKQGSSVGAVVRKFDPQADEIVVAIPLQGG